MTALERNLAMERDRVQAAKQTVEQLEVSVAEEALRTYKGKCFGVILGHFEGVKRILGAIWVNLGHFRSIYASWVKLCDLGH